MRDETLRWLKKAEGDLDTASFLLKGERPEAAAFHSQQAAEKGLKAVLIEREGRFPRIHDLVVLWQDVGAPSNLEEQCRALSQAYVESRYPDIEQPISLARAREFVSMAQEVLAWIRKEMS